VDQKKVLLSSPQQSLKKFQQIREFFRVINGTTVIATHFVNKIDPPTFGINRIICVFAPFRIQNSFLEDEYFNQHIIIIKYKEFFLSISSSFSLRNEEKLNHSKPTNKISFIFIELRIYQYAT